MQKTMMALVCKEGGALALEERPVPVLRDARDALVRVTLSTICTSDLHIRKGAVPRAVPGVVLGHEFVGEVVRVGDAVRSLRPGDRVCANCITFCGECWFCRRGYINNCVRGGWELGCRIDGCQAEYVRVPFADTGLTKLPGGVSDESALLVGDVLSSGYFGAQLADVRPGDRVAVIGAGPVGLCTAQCARLLGAAGVALLDVDPDRLAFARAHAACDLTVNPREEDAVRAIRAWTGGRGADGVVEAAGGEDTFSLAWQIARPNASVGIVAMYEKPQTLPLERMYGKNLTFRTGGVDAVHCAALVEWIAQGRLDTRWLLTHIAPLNRILEGYHTFENRRDGCIKWAVTPYER